MHADRPLSRLEQLGCVQNCTEDQEKTKGLRCDAVSEDVVQPHSPEKITLVPPRLASGTAAK